MDRSVLFLTIFIALCCICCDDAAIVEEVEVNIAEVTCPESTRPHTTECNKYFKCIRLPTNSLSWVALTCHEGLIYDKNLRSCAIPDDNWECLLNSEEADDENYQQDENNIYGIENLRVLSTEENDDGDGSDSDEFLEMIDGDEILTSRSEKEEEIISDDSSNFSGDGNVESFVTPSTVRMMTTQVQRLTQLVKSIPKTNSDDMTADDLNSFLDKQKIQTKSPEYQKIDFNSEDKTPMPQNGKIHPEILSEIIDRQNQLNTNGLKATTLAMDETTQASIKPMYYINKEPITEIQLKSGQGIDGLGSHQIVVNRPEGAVLFNVPSDSTNKEKEHPYISQDILKTILEISKQMVIQKNSNNQANNQQTNPIYYAIPVPIYQPQGSVQNFYGQYMNDSYRLPQSITTTTELPPIMKRNSKPSKAPFTNINSINGKNDFSNLFANNLKSQRKPQEQQYLNSYQQPLNYYSPYYNGYQQQNYPYSNYPSNYNSMYPFSDQNMYNNRYTNFDGSSYYENRPFVSDSSSPSYLDQQQHAYSKPYGKESYTSNDEDEEEYDAFHEESDDDDESSDSLSDEGYLGDYEEDEEEKPKSPLDGLICSLTRQANKTDCMQYYVCNPKTKEILSYACPDKSAFNDQTKYCDINSYQACKKSKDRVQGKLNNKRYFIEAHKALQQAKLESQKVERIANMVRKESQKIMKNKNSIMINQNQSPSLSYQPQMPMPQQNTQTFVQRRPSKKKILRPTSRPLVSKRISVISASQMSKKRKKKVKCKSVGNIADPEDPTSYWHCFKSPDDRMKRIHKKCTANLKFCTSTRYCSQQC